jgi:hypothetical protein
MSFCLAEEDVGEERGEVDDGGDTADADRPLSVEG